MSCFKSRSQDSKICNHFWQLAHHFSSFVKMISIYPILLDNVVKTVLGPMSTSFVLYGSAYSVPTTQCWIQCIRPLVLPTFHQNPGSCNPLELTLGVSLREALAPKLRYLHSRGEVSAFTFVSASRLEYHHLGRCLLVFQYSHKRRFSAETPIHPNDCMDHQFFSIKANRIRRSSMPKSGESDFDAQRCSCGSRTCNEI